MKTSIKITISIFSFLLLIIMAFTFYTFIITFDTNLDVNKLVNMQRTVSVYDDNKELISERVGNISVTEFSDIPAHTKNAFVAIEDKRFYSHNGIDFRGLIRATYNNLKSFSLKEGASTISQQLIKNTHLSNEKTLKRKILEIKLARQLEKKFTKDEILEKYLNTIYFGDGCYGITAAAKHYFDKKTDQLNLNESAVLAGIIKAPSNYSPFVNEKKCNDRKNVVLKEMFTQSYISKETFEQLKNTPINVNKKTDNTEQFAFTYLVDKEISEIINNSPYANSNLNVYTTQNSEFQKIIMQALFEDCNIDAEKSAVLMNNNGKILAYASTCGDVNRQLGSVIKPILVYAPSINENLVDSCSYINDEKTDFNGYQPSNYNDQYCGYISVKTSLAKSSNVCAVKLLNSLGVKNAIEYAKKCGLNYTENDNSLCLALGASEKGEKLTNITAAYNVFANHGYYTLPHCINSVSTTKGNILHNGKVKKTKVINKDTASIMNDILKEVVESGTAKKLSGLNFTVYAKTGTVGNEKGNTDAYCISYNKDYTLGIWFGNKTNSLLNNNVSGGTCPAQVACTIWNLIYDTNTPPESISNEDVSEISIDKITYETDRKIILADENAPDRYKLNVLLKNSSIPKAQSTRFTKPEIVNAILLANNKGIFIKLCHAEYCNALVYKIFNNKKILVFDTNINGNEFLDTNVSPNSNYTYTVVPYTIINGKSFMGYEHILEKIKTPSTILGEDWWLNEFI